MNAPALGSRATSEDQEAQVQASMTVDELLCEPERATLDRPLRRGGGDATLRRVEELYGQLVDAAVAHDLGALRAVAARFARELPGAALDRSQLRMASPVIE
jgi:hypothetical protein